MSQNKTAEQRLRNRHHTMIMRCHNPNAHAYDRYGGRGIYVCDRWKNKWWGFDNFLKDMGYPPEGYHLERRDNDGPYCKENCYWATRSQQERNKRTTVFLEINGVEKPLIEWAEQLGIPYGKLYQTSIKIRKGKL
jgi:hypothetical protein